MTEAAPSLPPALGRGVWRAAQMRGSDRWKLELTQHQVHEALGQVQRLAANEPPLHEITADAFPLPSWQPIFRRLRDELIDGSGVMLLRGLPGAELAMPQARLLFWGICAHLGTAVTQTRHGELVCDITDKGNPTDQLARTFATQQEAPFHVDNSDVVGLLCVRRAKEGGASLVSSAGAIYNRIRETRPQLLSILTRGFHRDRRGEHGAGEEPIGPRIPVFAFFDGRLASRFNPTFISAAARRCGVPFSEAEDEALATVAALAKDPEFALSMDFQPGDVQLLCNYTVLHSRTGYDDFPEPGRRRHLLRLWLEMPEFERLIPDANMRHGQIRYGNLGLNAVQWHTMEENGRVHRRVS